MSEINDLHNFDQAARDTGNQSLSRIMWSELSARSAARSLKGGGEQTRHEQSGSLDFNTRELYNNSQSHPRSDAADTQPADGRANTSYAKYINRQGAEVDDGGSDYRGSYINRDAAAEKYVVRSGDSLTSIARSHLGPGASQEQIQNHVREIEHVNHLGAHRGLTPGQRLLLPGHSADGGFVTNDGQRTRTVWQDGTERVSTGSTGYVRRPDGSEHHWGPVSTDNYDVVRTRDSGIQITDTNGNTRTRWNNGVIRVMNGDGTGFVQTPSSNGTYSEHHWGPRAQDNYELARTADGRYLLADRPGQAPRDLSTTSSDLRVQRPRVRDLAEQRLTDQRQIEQFVTTMDRFEERARSQNLPPEEVARTYDAVSQILETEGDSPLRREERARVAGEVLQNAAEPTSINQGMHPTCNVAAVEVRTYTRNPSSAARLVADVSTTTHFQTVDGTIVDVDSGSLHPDGDTYRNQASQIFQVAAVNSYWQRHGDIRYEQRPVNIGVQPPDNGERILDYSQNPPREFTNSDGLPLRQPWIDANAMHEISTQITGRNEAPFLISRADSESVNASTHQVDSQQGLERTLAQMQRDGLFPAVLFVHTRNEPFWTDSGSGAAGGSGGWHVLAVTDYAPGPPATVAVDNTWGPLADHLAPARRIPTDQLFAAMQDSARRVTIVPPPTNRTNSEH